MGAREDWSSYWTASDSQASCLPDSAGDAAAVLAARWADLAGELEEGASVVDLACGRGAAGKAMLAAAPGLRIEGVDYADLPEDADIGFPARGGVDLVSLPFPDGSMDCAISQYGFEYARVEAAGELVRILKPGGVCRLLVHHKDGAVVATNAQRAGILSTLLEGHAVTYTKTRNTMRLQSIFDPLIRAHGEHPLVLEIATACREALALPDGERAARCDALEAGMSRELGLLGALAEAAMGPGDVAALRERTASDMDWREPAIIRTGDAAASGTGGGILCWELNGTKKADGAARNHD